ncbi:MAG: ABC transporter permease [Bacilli bacterium]
MRFSNKLKSIQIPYYNVPFYMLVLLVGSLLVMPFLYIVIQAFSVEGERWVQLLSRDVPKLLFKTLSLTFVVTIGAVTIGTTVAFLIERTNLRFKRYFEIMAVVPLTISSYIAAVVYIVLLSKNGLVDRLFGVTIDVYQFWGVALIFIGFLYPYVYLLVSAAIRRSIASFEEAALTQLRPKQVFLSITLPMLKPSLFASALLVSVYVMSDFGAVAMLRYPTLTQVIYFQMGSYDRGSTAIYSFILIALTAILLFGQWYFQRKQKFSSGLSIHKAPRKINIGKYKWLAYIFLGALQFFTVFIPIGVLLILSYEALINQFLTSEWLGYIWNTLLLSVTTATIVMLISLPLVYFKLRMKSRIGKVVDVLSYISYSLPGVIVALGVIFVYIRIMPPMLYGTMWMLVTAYILRFLPQSLEASESTFTYVSVSLDEAAATLGRKPFGIIKEVLVPLTRSGLITGTALVFVSVMKELPATLLLRPAGMDTLSVRVWIEASEGYYANAGPSALLIVIISLFSMQILLKKRKGENV